MPDTPPNETPTVITLVLPTDTSQPATITVRNGDLGHFNSFTYDDFKDICVALNQGLAAFVQVQAEPPANIPSAKPTPQPKGTKTQIPAGKPPYKLLDASGKPRVLDKMFDPFDLQTKYHKDNPKFQFKDLNEAIEVATVLIESGLEKTITITYSNGKTAKVLPESEDPDTPSDDEEPEDTDMTDDDEEPEDATKTDLTADNTKSAANTVYPEALTTKALRAIYDVVQDEDLAYTIYTDVLRNKKYDWKTNLMKQREVKGFIAVHVDGKEDLVEALYEIMLASPEFDNSSKSTKKSAKKNQPVIQSLVSPDLAMQMGRPQYQEFALTPPETDNPQPTLF